MADLTRRGGRIGRHRGATSPWRELMPDTGGSETQQYLKAARGGLSAQRMRRKITLATVTLKGVSDTMASIMADSDLVWFEPTDNFWNYFDRLPWKWKQFRECGAGTGHLTRLMREHKFHVAAYDMFKRTNAEIPDIEVLDTTSADLPLDVQDCVLIARPCHHTGWVEQTFANTVGSGDGFYIGLEKNIEQDLGIDLYYGIVARDVGKDGEVLVRVYERMRRIKRLRLIKGYHGNWEWWWYRQALDRYVSDPEGLAGFDNEDNEVAEEHWFGHDLQVYWHKADKCHDELNAGWIAPDGEWFGCYSRDHDTIAYGVLGVPVARLERLNFIRCYGDTGDGHMLWSGYKKRPTTAQYKTLVAKGYNPKDWGARGTGLVSNKDFKL